MTGRNGLWQSASFLSPVGVDTVVSVGSDGDSGGAMDRKVVSTRVPASLPASGLGQAGGVLPGHAGPRSGGGASSSGGTPTSAVSSVAGPVAVSGRMRTLSSSPASVTRADAAMGRAGAPAPAARVRRCGRAG